MSPIKIANIGVLVGAAALSILIAGCTPGDGSGGSDDPSVPPSGSIVFASNRVGGDFEIWAMNPDGTNQRQLTDNEKFERYPDVSPDGARIVFGRGRTILGGFEIWAMNADGTNQRQLTDDDQYVDTLPAWSPGGARIAFQRDSDDDSHIWVMNADGSNQRQLTGNDQPNQFPHWSPDGAQIVFTSNWDIWVMNADGSNQRQLTGNDYFDSYPKWSPDGRQIVFNSQRGDNVDIWVMNADGAEHRRLTNNDDYEIGLGWSPDGAQIGYSTGTRVTGKYDLWVMNADGTNHRQLTNNDIGSMLPTKDLFGDWAPLRTSPHETDLPRVAILAAGVLLVTLGWWAHKRQRTVNEAD